MKKVLLIQEMIPHYRIPIYNELAQSVDLTIVYSKGLCPENVKFRCVYIPTKKIRYNVHTRNMYFFACHYDVVICMFDLSFIYTKILGLLPHKYKLIYWGIGVSAGYNSRYDEDQSEINVVLKYIRKSDAMLFYSDYPVQKYRKLGVPQNKLFVANNTVQVFPYRKQKKDSILFIGSLYPQKKLDVLLEAYLNAYIDNPSIPKLVIIGDGSEKSSVEQWIIKNKLTEKINLAGAIFDDHLLVPYFEKAIMCISPDQAGLSVLKSMGYGVPYVTHMNAITGGEIFNIHNGLDGVLLKDFNQLKDIIIDANKNTNKYILMGEKAAKYYQENRTITQMVNGFLDAINYVESENKN